MKDLREAARVQAFEGSTRGYRQLLRHYIETLPQHSPDLIFGSGDAEARGIRKERDGTITVAHPQLGRIAWRDAVRAGYIKPHLI